MRLRLEGESLMQCAACKDPILEAHYLALLGINLCVECQQERDGAYAQLAPR